MGTTAEKLTYLGVTKEKIRNSINLTGAGLTSSDTFRSYATKLNKSYVDIINNGTDTLYENFPKVSGMDSNLSLTPTYEAPMNNDELYGNITQKTYTGKNKLNLVSDSSRGVSGTVNADGTVTISGTATATTGTLVFSSSQTLTAGTYTLSISKALPFLINFTPASGIACRIAAGSTSATLTLSNDMNSGTLFMAVENGVTYNETFKIQLVSGSTADYDFEPYVGGKSSPNPDYPQNIENVTGEQNIEICGKNLLNTIPDRSSTNGVTVTQNDDKSITLNGTSTSNSWVEIDYDIKLNPGEYTLSIKNKKTGLGLYLGSENITTYGVTQNQANSYKTFTLENEMTFDKARIRIISGTVFENFTIYPQLEKNSVVTEYKPYQGNTYEVNLGKNIFDKNNINELRGSINSVELKFTYSSTSPNYCFYMSCKPNTTYTIQKRNDGDTNRFKFASCSTTILTQDSAVTNLTTRVSNDSASSLTITTGANDIYIIAQYYQSTETVLTKQQLLDSIQIEVGSQATSYTPYFTPIELNKIGNYQDSIKKSTGKNLFDKDNTTIYSGYFSASGVLNDRGVDGSSDKWFYIPCESNIKYTITKPLQSTSSDNRFRVGTYSTIPENGITLNDYWKINDGDDTTTYTITTGNNAKYLCVYYGHGSSNTDNIDEVLNGFQIEKGETATPCEPYGKVWYIEKNIGEVTLNGTTNAMANYNSHSGTTYISSNYNKGNIKKLGDTEITNASDKLVGTTIGNTWGGNILYSVAQPQNGHYIQICLPYSIASDVTGLNTWLETNNIRVKYTYQTPLFTEITNTDLISQLDTWYNAKSKEEQTNITVTSENLPVILGVSALKEE